MYGKVFATIFEGSLYGRFEATATMMVLITLANKHGEVDMTVEALAARTGFPQDILERGIEELLQPDPRSRTPGSAGRRIVPVAPHRDWGWKLVNYDAYRTLRTEDDRREYHAQYYRAKRSARALDQRPLNIASTSSTSSTSASTASTTPQQPQPIAEAEAEAEATSCSSSPNGDHGVRMACPVEEIVALYHANMPRNPVLRVLNARRRAAIRARWIDAANLRCNPFGYRTKADGLAAWEKFFQGCATSPFLTGRVKPQPGRLPFLADIDFLMSPDGFAKCLENKYHREVAA